MHSLFVYVYISSTDNIYDIDFMNLMLVGIIDKTCFYFNDLSFILKILLNLMLSSICIFSSIFTSTRKYIVIHACITKQKPVVFISWSTETKVTLRAQTLRTSDFQGADVIIVTFICKENSCSFWVTFLSTVTIYVLLLAFMIIDYMIRWYM